MAEVKSSQNASLDLFRGCACLLVVLIHTTEEIPAYSFVANSIARIAVPIFMLVSGYFFFKNKTNHRNTHRYFIETEKKIGQLFIFWTVIYLPLIRLFRHEPVYVKQVFLLKSLFGGNPAFLQGWYLPAVMFGLWIVYSCEKRNKMVVAYFLSTLIFFINVSTSAYGQTLQVFPKLYNFVRIFNPSCTIFTGIFWMTVAFFIYKHEDFLKKIINKKMLSLSWVIFLVEFFIVTKYQFALGNSSYLTLPFVSVLTFVYLLNSKIELPAKFLKKIRNTSTLVYCNHLWVRTAIYVIQRYVAINKVLVFPLTFLFSIILAQFILFVAQQKKYKLLQWSF